MLPGEWPLARSLATGEVISDEEYEILRGDNTRGIVSAGAAPIRDRFGHIIAAVTVIHDVTEHRELERALGRTRDELAMLLASSGDVASTLDVSALLRIVADRLEQIVPYSGLVVYQLTEDGKTLQVVAHYGRRVDEHDIRYEPVPVDQAPGLKEAIASRGLVLIPDLSADSPAARRWRAVRHPVQERLLSGARCWLAVPLAVQDRVIGVLRLTHDEPGRFTDHEAELALALAQHIALALENARLYEQAREVAALEERQRLARDLHDAVSQTLFSASLIADVLPRLWERDPELVKPRLEELKGLTRGARAEMRTLLWELRPETLLQVKLDHLLRQLGEAVGARMPIKITVTAQDGDYVLPSDAQVGLYRIVQEALNNVVKHSKAEHVWIDLKRRAGPAGVEICAEDDGQGFDLRTRMEGLGLRIMRERAQAIGAEVTIDSQVGAGTRVKVVWQEPRQV